MTKLLPTLCVTATLAGFAVLCHMAWPYHGYEKADVEAVNDLIARYVPPSLEDRQIAAEVKLYGLAVPTKGQLAEWKDVAGGRF